MERRFELAGVLAEHGVLGLRVQGPAGSFPVLEPRRTDLPGELAVLAASAHIAGEGTGWSLTILREGEMLKVDITGDAGGLGGSIAAIEGAVAE